MKQIVYYSALLNGPLTMGKRALVIPLNHPDTENVQNGMQCVTTPVQFIDGKEFHTWNTHYKWVDLEQLQEQMEKPATAIPD